jgi:hypothetical protein
VLCYKQPNINMLPKSKPNSIIFFFIKMVIIRKHLLKNKKKIDYFLINYADKLLLLYSLGINIYEMVTLTRRKIIIITNSLPIMTVNKKSNNKKYMNSSK